MTDLEKQIWKIVANKMIDLESDATSIEEREMFSEGCSFLMPLINKLIEQRDSHIVYSMHTRTRKAYLEKLNQEILTLLKGEINDND